MLLIFEIILTVTAWRRGWKAWALVPLATAFSIGFVIGASGGSMDTAMAVGLPVDLAAIGTLVAMVASHRTAEQGATAASGAAEPVEMERVAGTPAGASAQEVTSAGARAVEAVSAGARGS